jgi:DNA processing protein
MNEDLIYQIGLSLTPNIGPVIGKTMIAYSGSAKAVFDSSVATLAKIPSIGSTTASLIKKDILKTAEKEVEECQKRKISILSYTDDLYPQRLKHINSNPLVLYKLGSGSLNPHRSVSVVGTRTPTVNGKIHTEKIVEDFKELGTTVVSGFAYGVDSICHKKCVEKDIPTIAVLGNGLDKIYPSENRELFYKILENTQSAILSEFPLGTGPDRPNFPMRNRIIAAISDATIVVESKVRGGSMITAEYANEFNKDVFAIPGRTNDSYSMGCNALIKKHKAHLFESVNDLIYIMRWDVLNKQKTIQTSLFLDIAEEEKPVYDLLKVEKELSIDQLCYKLEKPASEVATLLLTMEFKGLLRSLPGKIYCLNA